MKKILFMALLTSQLNYSQTTVVTVGNDTFTGTTMFNFAFGFSREAQIYLSSEIGNTTPKTIKDMSIDIVGLFGPVSSFPTKIYFKQIGTVATQTQTTWANKIAGATLVWSGSPAFIPNVNAWNLIDITDFTLGANQNLEILVECNQGASGIGNFNSNQNQYTNTPSGSPRRQFWRQNVSEPLGLGGTNLARTNLRFTIENNLSSDGFELENNLFTLYPNPVYQELELNGNDLLKCNYSIYDISGKILTSGIIEESKKINVTDLAKGTYFLIMKKDDKRFSEKFIKE